MTIDTACSGALIGIDLAMRYLQTREISSAIVAGANLYCSPEHVMDHYMGANGAASLSGKCHTFDEKADGYIKAEAVNMVYLKRLDDAIRDKDPIRAIIRGTATNSDGWTAGIASPNSTAQSAAIRQAYKNAGITDLSQTSYVEFHGTGTRAGDSIEANGVASVFTPYQAVGKPLRIGSVKSNIGHSEPAAGLSGLLKTVLSLEKGIIPGNPTFITPSPKIDFEKLRVWTSRTATPWPDVPVRRASINSFGYGGSNAHIIVDEAKLLGQNHVSSYIDDDDEDLFTEEVTSRPYLLALSANDEKSLQAQLSTLDRHLSDPAVSVKLRNLAYTLSEKRSRHYHRGYLVANGTDLDLQAFAHNNIREETPKIGFIFTGQGAQWPEMGRDLLGMFPLAAKTVRHLDEVLQGSHSPPSWSLYEELVNPRSAEHLRLPEISQPLVTALQLAILALFTAAGVSCRGVVGHSSGEIAAAVAAGYLTSEQAIKIAYYRGKATSGAKYEEPLGMLAAGLGADAVRPYLDGLSVQIACINSPQGVTLSGKKTELVEAEKRLKDDKHFARLLLVDAAYHSRHMTAVADEYLNLLEKHVEWPKASTRSNDVVMFSSTTGKIVTEAPGPGYWVKNMVSPVLFSGAVTDMISQDVDGVDYLVEIGPSNALSGPVNQIKKAASSSIEYTSAWKRGSEAVQTLLETAGKLFTVGYPIRLAAFNEDEELSAPLFISDLPNYSWDHSVKYWHESESSIDWRYRKFVYHDLLGSKILGTPWTRPVWKNVLRLGDVTWIKDHLLGDSVVFPAAGYIAMAIEAIFQKTKATGRVSEETAINQLTYKLRNVAFPRMLTLDNHAGTKILLTLEPCMSTKESWHEFTISSIAKDGSGALEEHCNGLVSIGEHAKQIATDADVGPLKHAVPGAVWYKAMRDVGYFFGPAFQSCEEIEAAADSRHCRAIIKLGTPESRYPQNQYAMHPAAIDGCLQIATVALNQGHRSDIDTLMPPRLLDNLVIFPQSDADTRGIVASEAIWSGVGRPDDNKRYVSDIRTFSEGSNDMLFHLQGLGYHAINATADKPHVFTQVVWGEDVDFLTPGQVASVLKGVPAADGDELTLARIAKAVSIVAHKRPSARILEVGLDDGPDAGQSLWIDRLRSRAGQIAEGCAYRFSTPSQNAGFSAREKYSAEGNIEYAVHDADGPFSTADTADRFDVIIVKTTHPTTSLKNILDGAQSLVTDKGYLILVDDGTKTSQNGTYPDFSPAMPSTNFYQGTNGEVVASSDLALQGLETVPDVATRGQLKLLYLGIRGEEKEAPSVKDAKVHLVHFSTPDGSTDASKDKLATHGWDVVEHTLPLDKIPGGSTVLVVDEMFAPVLSNFNDDQFTALRELLERECRVLWVTMG